MTAAACVADIVAAGALWPAATPVTRPAPAAVAHDDWTAYRLDAAGEQALSPPGRIKRLGRGQAMAIVAVQRALAGCADPPARGAATAIAVGTAWAEEGDEIVFLENLLKMGEKGAKPAFFVNSVKNALASQLALSFGYEGENQTFAHDALSFESAVWQAARLLGAGRARHAVVCGVEALVEFQEIHGHLLGSYDAVAAPLAPLAVPGAGRAGTLPGEGAAAFVLVAPGSASAPRARLRGLRARGPRHRQPALVAADELAFIDGALRDAGTGLDEIGLVLVGANGERRLDAVYDEVARGLRARAPAPELAIGVYRHASGDFATASALGFELAVRTLATRAIPAEVRLAMGQPAPQGGVLLYHLSAAGYHSVMVVSS